MKLGTAAVLQQPETQDAISEMRRFALMNRVQAEIAALEATISSLRGQPGNDETIAQLQDSQALLRVSLQQVTFAGDVKSLRAAAATADTAVRHSTETRCSATSAPAESPTNVTKQVLRAIAAPVAGMLSFNFVGKTLSGAQYQTAIASLHKQMQGFIDGFREHVSLQAEMALKHSVDIMRSQQVQTQLIEQAKEAYVAKDTARAAGHLSEAATLGLRDAERVRDVAGNAEGDALVQRAEKTALDAARQAVDQMQLEARKDCTAAGKKGDELEACTMDAAGTKIETLRIRMIKIQMETATEEKEAEERATRILRSLAPHDALEQARKQAQEAKAGLSSVTIMTVEQTTIKNVSTGLSGVTVSPVAANAKITPAETPVVEDKTEAKAATVLRMGPR